MTIRTFAALAAASLLLTSTGAFAQSGSSAVAGTAGSAAAGDTSASTAGIGATSKGPSGTSSSLATGGSAAGPKTMDRSHVNATGNNGLHGDTKAMAHDGGTFSMSQTQTRVVNGTRVDSGTRTLSHVQGQQAVRSTTRAIAGGKR